MFSSCQNVDHEFKTVVLDQHIQTFSCPSANEPQCPNDPRTGSRSICTAQRLFAAEDVKQHHVLSSGLGAGHVLRYERILHERVILPMSCYLHAQLGTLFVFGEPPAVFCAT